MDKLVLRLDITKERTDMITIQNLTKKYEDLTVLEEINLEIRDGEIYGLVGISGVGKSTLLGCLNGLESYSQGSICIDGVYVERLRGKALREFRKRIGIIFQSFSLISRKNVYQNIAFPMECWGYSKEQIDRQVRAFAEVVGIQDKLDERPDNLSGGQKQRVAIARALVMEPKYILCDECTSALDPGTTNAILALLKSIHEKLGITIIIVTHEMAVIQKICQRIAILENGRIIENGWVKEIFRKQPQALLNLTGEKKKPDTQSLQNLLELQDVDLEKVMNYCKENNIEYQEVKREDIIC